jgi:hypothetical protein
MVLARHSDSETLQILVVTMYDYDRVPHIVSCFEMQSEAKQNSVQPMQQLFLSLSPAAMSAWELGWGVGAGKG